MTARIFACAAALVALTGGAADSAEITLDQVKKALPKLEALIEKGMERTGVPGVAVAVVYKDQVPFMKGFGVRKAGYIDPVDPDTVFQLASVSKPLASTAIASVVGTGEVTFDTRLADIDPAFSLIDPWVSSQVTIRDLLSHRSGLPDYAGDLLEDLGYGQADVLRRLRYIPLSAGFRAQYAYTNFGVTAAGVAVAKAAGESWDDLIAERVFKPLGMTHSSSRYADFEKATNAATIHKLSGGAANARFRRNADAQAPAGGVSSTLNDLTRWVMVHLNEGKLDGQQVIDTTALAETHRPQITMGGQQGDRPAFYGLGWVLQYLPTGDVQIDHGGAFFVGARTQVLLLPGQGIGIIILTNAFPTGLPEALSRSFVEILTADEPSRDWLGIFDPLFASLADWEGAADYGRPPVTPAPALPPLAYVGRYASPLWGDVEVAEADGGLAIRIGPQADAVKLHHYERDVFSFYFLGKGDEGERTAGAAFTVANGAFADSVVIDLLNANGLGTFKRTTAAD